MAGACNPSTQGTEAGEAPQIQAQPELYRDPISTKTKQNKKTALCEVGGLCYCEFRRVSCKMTRGKLLHPSVYEHAVFERTVRVKRIDTCKTSEPFLAHEEMLVVCYFSKANPYASQNIVSSIF